MRVALFTEIIAPYRIPVFNEIAKKADFFFKVFFLKEMQRHREWPVYKDEIKFHYETLPGFLFEGNTIRTAHFNPTVIGKLIFENYDVAITGGWHQPSYYLVQLYTRLWKKKLVLWCESTGRDHRNHTGLPKILRRLFIQGTSGSIVPGKASKNYLLSMGVPEKKIWIAPNAVDSGFYASASAQAKKNKNKIKIEKGLPEKLLLYVGRLDPEKGLLDLLQAYAEIKQEMKGLGLVLCGDGSQRETLEAFCRQKALKDIFFAGFLSREELSVYYGISDLFVLPSHTEPWGLVVNEAMSCGLPVLCSKKAGAADDLIMNGENGYVFEPGDIPELAGLVKNLLLNPKALEDFGEKSVSIIQGYSPSRCAEGFLRAILEV